MSERMTCDTCGAPITQNEHGETWHTPAADRIAALEAQLAEARVAALKEAACWVAGLSREAEELVLSLVDAKPADAMGAGPEGDAG